MDFDAIIVGGGAAGAAVTWQLVSNGMKVACLERGPWMLPNEYPSTRYDWELQKLGAYSPVSAIRQSRYDYPIDDSESPVAVCNFNAVGGSTILYSGHYPRFRPNDFTLRSDHGLGEDWPISYEELRPFYEANETETGVAGLAGDPAYPDIEHLLPPVPLGSKYHTTRSIQPSWMALVAKLCSHLNRGPQRPCAMHQSWPMQHRLPPGCQIKCRYYLYGAGML